VKIRTIFADDEPLARDRLRQLLSAEPEIEIVAECSDGRSAAEKIEELKPDLVLLDVQMPELDGFGVIEALDQEKLPLVIFVTAHDQFALKAFEVHAIDYILKPFNAERFRTALNRALARLKQEQAKDLSSHLSALLGEVRQSGKPLDRLVIRSDGRMIFVKLDDVDWIEAADNYVSLHVGAQNHLLRETMNALEKRLPNEKFMRISRSTIVNLDRIKELEPLFHGDYVVVLRNGTKLTLTRGYKDKLQQLLGKI
jgi:two-component system LytT family response regulator